jgi:hypothetical protein
LRAYYHYDIDQSVDVFDIIAELTLGHPLCLLDQGIDVNNMMKGIESIYDRIAAVSLLFS